MRYGPEGGLEVEDDDICYDCRYVSHYMCPLVNVVSQGLAILAVPKGESIQISECDLFRSVLRVVE
jgi:hypothetical protein